MALEELQIHEEADNSDTTAFSIFENTDQSDEKAPDNQPPKTQEADQEEEDFVGFDPDNSGDNVRSQKQTNIADPETPPRPFDEVQLDLEIIVPDGDELEQNRRDREAIERQVWQILNRTT